MDLLDFFNPNKKTERRPIIAGGRMNLHLDKEVDSRPVPQDNKSYASKFQEHELLTMKHVKDEEAFMDADEEDGAATTSEPDMGPGQNDEIYKKYNFTNKITPRLPIAAYRKEIMATLEKNSVVVIEGPTGCGKTTQVPQYIMEEAFVKKKYFNIVVTQPRRLAAVTVAKRVANERQWELGEVVGFKIGRKRETGDDTRITFCTTGVLLEKLVKRQNLDEYTHIILDEVHERDIDMDFLLIVIRKLFYRTRSPVKLIMMSATIKSEKFSSYFHVEDEIPIINLRNATQYAVKEYYLEDIKKINYAPQVLNNFSNSPDITADMYNLAAKLVFALDQIEKKPREYEDGASADTTGKSVLIFLPGIHEINQLHRELEKLAEQTQGFKYEIIPLHSSLTHEEQQKVFRNFPASTRKVILSTNIAESSITVPDVRYVIDFCLTKNIRIDSTTNFSTLKLEWASVDNCRQRAGRAGRVMDGRVYRLVSKRFYEQNIPKHITPEMQRTSLETVVLKSKLIEMGAPETVLALAMDPPLKSDVYNAILVLKELGGLLNTVNGEFVLNDGDMTYLGIIMANMPVDIRVSRLIMLGYAFSVVDEAIIIGAGLSVQGVFSETFKQEMNTYATKLGWANGSGSDLIALLNVYKVYTERIKQSQSRYEAMWAKRCGIQIRMMREVVELVQELNHRLSYYNIQTVPMPYGVSMNDYERCIILKTVIAGAFYPNYSVYGSMDADKERDTFRMTNGRDPSNTVVLTGLHNQHVGKLYRKTIREMFSSFVEKSTKIDVNFDHSERVYVTFHPNRSVVDSQKGGYLTDVNMDDNVSGNVLLEVYKAVKYGQIKKRHGLNVLNSGKAEQYAIDKGAAEWILGEFHWKRNDEMRREYVVYPRKNYINGMLTHFVHPHKFYVQPIEEMPYEEHMRMMLNSEVNLCDISKEDLKVGMMVAAKRRFGKNFYNCRARVVKNDHADPINVDVFFIDFGNTEEVMVKNVRRIRPGIYANECPIEQLPPRCLECRLACVAPTAISSVRGRWTMETVKKFNDKLKIPSNVMIEVYAFVDGVAYVILNYERENMNEFAVTMKYAQYTDENYMVKFDHDRRVSCEQLKQDYILDDSQLDYMVNPEEVEITPPSDAITDKEIYLNGPNSPLAANLFFLSRAASKKVCKIERGSVNCVLLDTDFQDYPQKMVVASHVKKVANGDLCLYATTIMPNIPGILPLLSLIFCPTAEFSRDTDCSRFISVLTGLGTRPGTKIPTYEEHDMQIPLDVKIDHDDIECINQLRYSISSLLLLRTGQGVPELENNVRYKLLHKIKELIISILTRSRPLCERKYPPKSFAWNQCDTKPTDRLELKDILNGASIFPFLTSLKLDPTANREETKRLDKNCKELHNIISFNRINKGGAKCLLCDTYLNDVLQVRLHLFTKLHKDREAEIGYRPENL